MDDVDITVETTPLAPVTAPATTLPGFESFWRARRQQWRWYRQKALVCEATERQLRVLRPVMAKKGYFEVTRAADISHKAREFNDLFIPVQDVLCRYVERYEIHNWIVECETWMRELVELGFLSEETVSLQEYYRLVPKKYASLERLFHALRSLKGEYVPLPLRPQLRV